MSKSKIKTMIVFFNHQGVVHKEFVPLSQTMNQTFCREVLDWLRRRVLHVRPEIAVNCILHHDNTPYHGALSVREFLASKQIPVLPQPPYSPDLAPCDFFLFPNMKNRLKGHHFGTVDNIKGAATEVLNGLMEEDFQRCFLE
jgi:transposase